MTSPPSPFLHGGVELAEEADLALVAETHRVADRNPLAGPGEGGPARAVEPLDQIGLDRRLRAAPDAAAAQTRRDHARIVDHELVARLQQVGQVAHRAILRRRARPHDQQPRGIARTRGAQRDPLGRQRKVEQVCAHVSAVIARQGPATGRPDDSSGGRSSNHEKNRLARSSVTYNAVFAGCPAFAGHDNRECMPSTAVIQVKRGIGDVVWHLPFIRAIAAATPERAVTFLTLPSTRAKDLLTAEPSVGEVIYFEHQGSELARGINLVQLVALMRARKFQRIWILDRTIRPASPPCSPASRSGSGRATAAAPPDHQCGDRSAPFQGTGDGLAARADESMNVPVASTEPDLKLPERCSPASRRAIRRRGRGSCSRSAARIRPRTGRTRIMRRCSTALRRRTSGTVFLIGGADNAARAQALIARSAGAPAVNACDLRSSRRRRCCALPTCSSGLTRAR